MSGVADWERIEADYRAGLLSLREIAAKDGGVTEGAIRKRAKKEKWARDLGAKIQQRADELVRKEAVRTAVRAASAANEREIVEANALRIAQVRNEHRQDITRSRAMVLKLLAELETQTDCLPEFLKLGEMLRREDDKGVDKLNDIYRAVISLPERTKTMKALSESLKNLIGLEREAYGLDVKASETDPNAAGSRMGDAETANRLAFILNSVRGRVPAGGDQLQ